MSNIMFKDGKPIGGIPQKGQSVTIPFMTKLWENPSPSNAFAGQTILIDLSDYDFIYAVVSAETIIIPINGNGYRIQRIAGASSAPYHSPQIRDVSATSTGVSFGNGMILNVSGGTTDNTALVPTIIYGLKKSYAIEDVAIANVSTSATQCIMSDNVTTVEEAINSLDTTIENALSSLLNWTSAGEVTSTSYVTISVPNTAKEILAVLRNSDAVLETSIIPSALFSTPITLRYAVDTTKELYYNGNKWKITASGLTGIIYYR